MRDESGNITRTRCIEHDYFFLRLLMHAIDYTWSWKGSVCHFAEKLGLCVCGGWYFFEGFVVNCFINYFLFSLLYFVFLPQKTTTFNDKKVSICNTVILVLAVAWCQSIVCDTFPFALLTFSGLYSSRALEKM